ncbi:MAG TPA: hypothetical protein VFB99_11255 [Vicinamibacterales bacterium]|nr:hypothetical protein [Vicinamibacterales bacterium]
MGPILDNTRLLNRERAARDGCVYRLIVEYEPRTGAAGLFDRTLVRRSVEQAMRRTIQNLDRRFHKQPMAV